MRPRPSALWLTAILAARCLFLTQPCGLVLCRTPLAAHAQTHYRPQSSPLVSYMLHVHVGVKVKTCIDTPQLQSRTTIREEVVNNT